MHIRGHLLSLLAAEMRLPPPTKPSPASFGRVDIESPTLALIGYSLTT